MQTSAVSIVFGLPLPVLHFIADSAHQCIYVSILWSSTSSFFSKFGIICSELKIWLYANFVHVISDKKVH